MPFVKGEQPKGSKPFKKGQPSPNPNGRPKGLKKQVKELLTKHIPDIDKQLEGASSEDKIKLLASFADLIKPVIKTA